MQNLESKTGLSAALGWGCPRTPSNHPNPPVDECGSCVCVRLTPQVPVPFCFSKPVQCSDVQNETGKENVLFCHVKLVFFGGGFWFFLILFRFAPHRHGPTEKLFSWGGGGWSGCWVSPDAGTGSAGSEAGDRTGASRQGWGWWFLGFTQNHPSVQCSACPLVLASRPVRMPQTHPELQFLFIF